MSGIFPERSGKSKVYFTILVDGVPRTLFSVREGKTHDGLTLIMKSADNFYDEDHHGVTTKGQRYSIHDSPETPEENTIKHTLLLGTGQKIETYCQTAAIAHRRAQPIFFRECVDLSPDKYRSNASAKDVLVSLGSYDPKLAILHYGVFIAPRGKIAVGGSPKYGIVRKDFRVFSIQIPYCFTYLPSVDRGVIQHLVTCRPRVNEVTPEPNPQLVSMGMGVAQSKVYSERVFANLHNDALAHSIGLFRENGDAPPMQILAALKKLGPGTLTHEQVIEQARKIMRRSKGSLPSEDEYNKLQFGLHPVNAESFIRQR